MGQKIQRTGRDGPTLSLHPNYITQDRKEVLFGKKTKFLHPCVSMEMFLYTPIFIYTHHQHINYSFGLFIQTHFHSYVHNAWSEAELSKEGGAGGGGQKGEVILVEKLIISMF